MKKIYSITAFVLLNFLMTAQPNNPQLVSLFEKLSFKYDTATINYRFFKPANLDQSKKYPLVLTLHGAGERGSNNELQIVWHALAKTWVDSTNQEVHPCFVLSPQCPTENKWVDVNWGSPTVDQDTIPISNELNAVIHLIDELIEAYPVDTNRIYVTGLSMGGFGTWDLITRFPGKFAAAIPLSGAGDPAKVNLIKHMPIWVFHGSKDQAVPVEGSRIMVNALRAAGSNVIYTELPEGAHVIWKPIYENPLLIDWLFAQKLSKD